MLRFEHFSELGSLFCSGLVCKGAVLFWVPQEGTLTQRSHPGTIFGRLRVPGGLGGSGPG